jgi:hypothetical protein
MSSAGEVLHAKCDLQHPSCVRGSDGKKKQKPKIGQTGAATTCGTSAGLDENVREKRLSDAAMHL